MYKRLLLFGLLIPVLSIGQVRLPVSRSTQAFLETGGYGASGGQTPFWLRANQYGIVPLKPTPGFARGGIVIPYRTTRNRLFDWGGGADVVANAGSVAGSKTAAVLVPELYVKARMGLLEIYASRRREIMGLADSSLGSGSYIWSGNALPMPKIQIALRDYAPIPFTNGVLSVKGTYAHGWFPAEGFVDHSFLHQASLYGRLGKASWPVRFYGGFNHQAQWGGQTTKLPSSFVENGGQFPGSFRDYLDVVTGASLGTRRGLDSTKYSTFDSENRIGNHLGTVDVAMEVQLKKWAFFAYRQSIYEDGSLFHLTNITDGLHGLRLQNKRPTRRGLAFTTVLLEYLDTRSQGGDQFVPGTELRGRDNYFNHQQYRDGWSYRGQTIGTPFIPPASTTLYPQGADLFTNNNRVQAYHLGVAGQIGGAVTFQTKLSFSQNYGTYTDPIAPTANQFSGGLWVGAPLSARHGLSLTASVAVDKGTLYPDNVGGSLSIRKTWIHDRDRLRGQFTSADTVKTAKPVLVAAEPKTPPTAKPVAQSVATPVKPNPVVLASAKVPTAKAPPAKTPAPVALAKAPAVTVRSAKTVPVRSENSYPRSGDFPVIETRAGQARTTPPHDGPRR